VSGPDDRPGWLAGTRAALDAIERGELRKVVLARHVDLALERAEAIDVAGVIEELARRFPTCTRFLLSYTGTDFFGATPETLVERRGSQVRAEAMAGSCRRGDEASLETSTKDAREHALVVEEIVARLRPLCDRLAPLPAPTIRRFANVAHLWTPLHGTLAGPAHVLELVAALHPTPAVAGTPTDAAVALLGLTEPVTRGWFAAPFGWFDATGDGHFVVALRSCIRHAGGLRLYAGAGIVRGSDPEREFDETVLKMRAVLDTLHGIPEEPANRVG
jgi:menaquinone-specific isochorismate synthase